MKSLAPLRGAPLDHVGSHVSHYGPEVSKVNTGKYNPTMQTRMETQPETIAPFSAKRRRDIVGARNANNKQPSGSTDRVPGRGVVPRQETTSANKRCDAMPLAR